MIVVDGRRLLERLQERVLRVRVHPVGAVDDDHATRTRDRPARRRADRVAHLLDEQLHAGRLDHLDVRMCAVRTRAGTRRTSAAAVRTDERRAERERDVDGQPSGHAREQVRVRDALRRRCRAGAATATARHFRSRDGVARREVGVPTVMSTDERCHGDAAAVDVPGAVQSGGAR